jgi:DNA polymerase-3 subunit beta
MKITCTQENLSRALSSLERAIGKQAALPILSNFLLRVENGKLKLSSTNLEIGVTTYVNAKIEGNGEIAAPVRILSNFVGNLPNGEIVTMNIQGNTLSLESGGYNMSVRGLDPKDFPIIPEKKDGFSFVLPAQSLKTALQRISPCVSMNESRIELSGVNLLFNENEVCVAATDSFRLAEQIIQLPGAISHKEYDEFREQNPSLILPYITIQELTRVIVPETKEIIVTFEENQVFFDIEGVSIVSRIINGKYPDYKQILPKEFLYSAKLSHEDFLRAVRMANVFTSRANSEMEVSVFPEKGEICIIARSSDIGENKTVIQGEISGGEPLRILFNPRYMIDGLNSLSSDKILFSLNSPSTPAGLCMVNENDVIDQEYLYIAMPIRK